MDELAEEIRIKVIREDLKKTSLITTSQEMAQLNNG
jgi:hypothetical protein